MFNASNTSEQREWYPLDSIRPLESRITLVYVADNPLETVLSCRDKSFNAQPADLEKAKGRR